MLATKRRLMIAATQRFGSAATRGANLLLSSNITKGSGVTGSDTDGTPYTGGTLTFPANTNVLAQFQAPLSVSTSYTLTYNYSVTAGGNLKAQDGATTLGTPQPFTTDGSTHSATYAFTTPGTLTNSGILSLAADAGLYGPGTVSSLYLSTP